ncbi:PQQ-binding-like beta-propeller repeat protein [Halovenus rubra]|uniref:PQQ-binding-like beta-propeller repeat protein n=2 Tax=Halovenus rubra TaxID=869890 RepID=A0ACC7E0C6_9EURY|nr:PQQ-binding-like beta-propeller repeat protein [Halovenus rubra]
MSHGQHRQEAENEEWTTSQFDRRRTGYAGGDIPREVPKKPPLRAAAIRESPPAVAYGAVFTASGDGSVCAYDIASGETLWECDVDGRMNANVSVSDGRVFGGTRDGQFFAIDAASGEIEWTFEPEAEASLAFTAKPTIDDGVVYTPCRGNGMMYALDAATGETEWEFEANYRYLECPPVVYDDWVYFGDGNGDFFGVNPEYAIDEWTHEMRGTFETAPAAANGLIFANSDSNLHAFDAESGEQVWRSTNTHNGSPTVVDDVVYAGIDDGIVGYDAETGEQIVTYETDARKNFSPAFADGVLYFATYDETIVAVDTETDETLWEFETDKRVESPVVVADGAVFAVDKTTGDALYALTEGADDIEPAATVSQMDIREMAIDDENEDDIEDEPAEEDLDDGPSTETTQTTTDNWSMSQGLATRTGYAGGGVPHEEPKKPPWTAEADNDTAPAVAYGAVFTASDDESVRAYDIESGELHWECNVDGKVKSNVAVADGRVFGGTRDGVAFGIDAVSGEAEWTFEPEADTSLAFMARPTIDDGTVYLPCRGNGMLYALDAESGDEEWSFEANERYLRCPPVVHDGWVYFGDGGGDFYAVNPEYAIDEWTHEMRADFETAPAVAGDLIIANADTDLHAFDAESGEQVWRSTNFHNGSPTVVGDTVYAATDSGIVGYDIEDGEEIYTFEADGKLESLGFAEGLLIAGNTRGSVKAIDPDADELVWEYENEGVDTNPVIADGAVFVMENSWDEPLMALTEGADPIEADASIGEMDIRDAELEDEAVEDEPPEEDADDGPSMETDQTADDGWSTSQGLATRTGYAGGGVPEEEPKKPPWTADSINDAPPAIAYGAAFTATNDDSVRAYDVESGGVLWECELDEPMQTNVSAGEGYVVGGTRDGIVFGIDAESGELEWTFEPEDEASLGFVAKPTIDDGLVYITCRGNGMLYALDAETGEVDWSFEADHRYVTCSPVVHDGWVYFGDGGDAFYAINPEYEIDEWKWEPTRAEFETAPAAAGDHIFVMNSGYSDMNALDSETGEQVWRSTNSHYSSPTVVDDVVYAITQNGIVGYDIESGEELYMYESDDRLRTLSFADGLFFAGNAGGSIQAIDPEAKEMVWEYENEGVKTNPIIADGAVFVVENGHDEPLLALTEGADPIEPDASVGSMDVREGKTATQPEDDETEDDDKFTQIALEQVEDPDEPTDEELEAVVLGIICDQWVDSDRFVHLNSNNIQSEVDDLVSGASEGLAKHTLQQLAKKGCVGYEDKNRYALIESRPGGIHLYENHTGEEVVEEHKILDVLEPLYQEARHNPDTPAITREQMQEVSFLDEEELDRTIWYLDTLGKWVDDLFLGKAKYGYIETRAMAGGTFWHEAEITGSGKELYNDLN